jgi:hypothetical protein
MHRGLRDESKPAAPGRTILRSKLLHSSQALMSTGTAEGASEKAVFVKAHLCIVLHVDNTLAGMDRLIVRAPRPNLSFTHSM